ncbi:MAG: MFS transporter [Candidatus Kapabacteria bacterium]|nr:MFS transporter [Candidatus Kapabacteria bacterium]
MMTNNISALRGNITKLYVLQVLRYFMVIMPVIVLFFQSVGLTMRDIMVIQAVFSFVSVVFEIPSGYFSDVLGRRMTLIIGVALGAAGFGLYVLATGFWSILAAECVLGLGMSFVSGTDSAMMFDTLAGLGEAERSMQSEGRLISFGNFSEGLAGITGGLLAALSLRFPLYAQFIVMLIAVPVAWSLKEPARALTAEHADSTIGTLRGIWDVSKWALTKNPRLRWLLLYSGVIGAGTLTMVWFIQPYMQRCGLPVEYFGFAWTALNLSVGTVAMNAHRTESALGERNVVVVLLGVLVLGFCLTGTFAALWSLPFVLCFYVVRGLNNPIFNTYINRIVPGDRRATVLSVRQLTTRLVFSVFGPVAGWIADETSQQVALYVSGAVFAAAGLFMLFVRPHEQGETGEVRSL